jgi:hypothetical protein
MLVLPGRFRKRRKMFWLKGIERDVKSPEDKTERKRSTVTSTDSERGVKEISDNSAWKRKI